MKEYTLTAGNRRPLRFKGDLIASTIDHEAFTKKLVDGKNTIVELLSDGNLPKLLDRISSFIPSDDTELVTVTWLTLFKTEGGSFVLLEERFGGRRATPTAKCDVYASFAECVEANQKDEEGSFGFLSTQLFNTAIENYPEDPELTSAWVQSID
ncbi:MAG: hypothetical protein ACON39_03890 [Coraliomargaritaceae bacterium]